jgi:tetratricopeptide (TPR) repeat protein
MRTQVLRTCPFVVTAFMFSRLCASASPYMDIHPYLDRAVKVKGKVVGLNPTVAAALSKHVPPLTDYDAARPLLDRILQIKERQHAHTYRLVASSLLELTPLLETESHDSLPLSEPALKITQKRSRSEDRVVAVGLINLADTNPFDYKTKKGLYQRALEILQANYGEVHPDTAECLDRIAAIDYDQGDYDTARILYERALRIREKISGRRHSDIVKSLSNLAMLLASRGDYSAATPLLERALKICQKSLGQSHPYLGLVVNDLGAVLQLTGNYQGAVFRYQQALNIWKRKYGPQSRVYARGLNNLASVLQATGQFKRARLLYEQVLRIHYDNFAWDTVDVAVTLANLAFVFRSQGDDAESRRLYEESLNILEKAPGSQNLEVALVLDNLALLDWKERDLQHARDRFLSAARLVDVHAQGLLPTLSLAEQRAFISTILPTQTSLLLSSQFDEPSLGRAYDGVYRWKGLLINSLRRETVIAKLAEEPRYQPLVERLRAMRAEVAGWYHKAGSMPFDIWSQRNDELTKEKELLERELAKALPSSALEDPLRDMGVQALKAILKGDEAFIDVYRYSFYEKGKYVEERFCAIVTGPQSGPTLVNIGRAEKVKSLIKAWRDDVLRDRSAESLWEELSATVWKPLAAILPRTARKVFLSPDGELARLPWQLLPETQVDTKQILISQTDSARELIGLLQRSGEPRSRPESMLLAGAIDFNAGARGSVVNGKFAPIHGTEAEVDSLRSLAERLKVTTTMLKGEKATKEAISKGLPTVTFAHLSTHGFFSQSIETADPVRSVIKRPPSEEPPIARSARNPLVESGIALAGANVRDPLDEPREGAAHGGRNRRVRLEPLRVDNSLCV